MSKKLKKINNWIESNGYHIVYGNVDMVDPVSKVVMLTKRKRKSHQIYTALHECGHIHILLNENKYLRKYMPVIVGENIDGRHQRSNLFRVNKVKEEMDAWKRGKKLAKELKIKINAHKYECYGSKCIMTYCK
jgi:hypothetical protein